MNYRRSRNEFRTARNLSFTLAVFSCLLFGLAGSAGQTSEPLSLTSTISLPDVHGRIDHFGVDIKGERLFMAAVGNGTLEVIDLKSGQRVHTIGNLEEPQGVFYDPATNHLFVACGGDGVTRIFDGTTFAAVGQVKFPDDADNIRYDAHSKDLVVGYAGTKELSRAGIRKRRPGLLRCRRKKNRRHCHRRPPRIFST